jgi:pilus assembly protein CpaB
VRKRAGILLIVSGLALAAVTAVVVMGIARQASAASQAQVRQVLVVIASRDIYDLTPVTADALEAKPFPADFAPPGAFPSVSAVLDRFVDRPPVASGFIPKGGIVVAGQLQSAPNLNLSERIPAGMVVMWLPMPDLLASENILKPGDHVDVLLTAPVRAEDSDRQTAALSTQTTLQNVQIYRIGEDELNGAPPSAPTQPGTAQPGVAGAGSAARAQTGPTAKRAIGVLVDHQDAVTLKFVKDAGGTIDLVTRSDADQQIVGTDGVTLDSLTDRFRFRIPQPVQQTNAARPTP